jgi:hypothetical protein
VIDEEGVDWFAVECEPVVLAEDGVRGGLDGRVVGVLGVIPEPVDCEDTERRVCSQFVWELSWLVVLGRRGTLLGDAAGIPDVANPGPLNWKAVERWELLPVD